MANRDSYIEFLLDQLAPLGEVTTRKMFGGNVIYCDGIVFALVASDALYLKVDDENRPTFEAKGLKPFHPFDDPAAVMQYYQAPPEIFEDPRALRHWAGSAVGAGRRKLAKKPKKKSKRAVSGKSLR